MSAERTAALKFPESAEDLTAAFNRALAAGSMQRERPDKVDYWARHEFLAYDAEDGVDVFWNGLSGQFLLVPRTEVKT